MIQEIILPAECSFCRFWEYNGRLIPVCFHTSKLSEIKKNLVIYRCNNVNCPIFRMASHLTFSSGFKPLIEFLKSL